MVWVACWTFGQQAHRGQKIGESSKSDQGKSGEVRLAAVLYVRGGGIATRSSEQGELEAKLSDEGSRRMEQ